MRVPHKGKLGLGSLLAGCSERFLKTMLHKQINMSGRAHWLRVFQRDPFLERHGAL